MGGKKILIADDEPDILEMLEYALLRDGFEVYKAQDGEETLRKAAKHLPDIILLDVMMPKMDGIEVCRALRQDNKFENTIILILTARSEEYSEVAGFEAGADDYVTKPVKIRSLLHRLGALQRRGTKPPQESLQAGPFVIDREKYLIIKHGEEIKLPRKEFELLHLLVSMRNKVVTREKIFEEIWGQDVIVVDRTIDVHIRRIRIKIGEQYIQTVKGVGYKFVVEDQ
ncbi:MAG: response regulator transcription factor [Bacteroidetes bacterium]|nr:response regulator transcription factor [Bacteroidota bacterium]MBL0015047.1 response regulator transcription factor [Bacteroidota bacterium]MBP6638727.1 response regulator transcription factor [Bacteroidia bacterium]MBP6722360.1 response regulator transcription factor [Bacteroidia bacterium]MBP8073736.1 response regulator transcription factor [Bacteroidia bacterium]